MDVSKLSRRPTINEWVGRDAGAQVIIKAVTHTAGENILVEEGGR